MCGIAGYLDAQRPVAPELFQRMRDTMLHRGPDGAGSWLSPDGRVALGHRRLAIVDLTPSGHQPMLSGDGRYVITFNGEIYNHAPLREELRLAGFRFRGGSDTEVLLNAFRHWGRECLQHLAGMFAFAIYDTLDKRLFAVRDRAGEKPFFYRHDGNRLVFASELKALLAHPELPRRINIDSLNHYLGYGYVPRDLCILDGYAKLPAGHWLDFVLESGALTIRPYWRLPLPAPSMDAGPDELLDELERLLNQSVARQLMADVPVGILLSGGLDSSLVAATAVRVSSAPVKTFTISFPGHASHDESPYARQVAAALGTAHTELPADAGNIDLLPRLAAQFDEPIADNSMLPTFLVSRLVRQYCTVALGGDGGDELFGGYSYYPRLVRLNRIRQFGLHRLGLEPLAARLLPLNAPGRNMALAMLNRHPIEATLTRMLDPDMRHRLLGRSQPKDIDEPEALRAALIGPREGVINRVTAADFQAFMCDYVLVKVDRASMLNSLELRAPLLDHAIAEFAFGRVPEHQKVAGNNRKILLRGLAKRLLPPEFDSSRKQGFSIPLGAWLQGPWRPLVDDLLRGGSPLFEPKEMQRALSVYRANDRDANRIFSLAILEAWRRHYRIEL